MDDLVVKCSACTVGTLTIQSEQVDVPYFGEVLLTTLVCPGCGYRSSDVVPLNKLPPMRYRLLIDDPNKLKVRVVRSGSSVVQIPQIGARIDPGIISEGYVTNVEGILQRFLNILYQLLREFTSSSEVDEMNDKIERTRSIIDLLNSCIDGRVDSDDPLTLIIEDPYGNSAIIGDDEMDIEKESLTDEEIVQMLDLQIEKNVIEEI